LRSSLMNQLKRTKIERQKLNRIKVVLAETGYTGKWFAEQLGKDFEPDLRSDFDASPFDCEFV